MRNYDNYGSRDFNDRRESRLGRGMERLGQMGRSMMDNIRRDRDEDRNEGRRYADDYEGRNRYSEWQNRYSLGNRPGMQDRGQRMDSSSERPSDRDFERYPEQYSSDRYDLEGRYGSEAPYSDMHDFNRFDSQDRFGEDYDRYEQRQSPSYQSSSYMGEGRSYGAQQGMGFGLGGRSYSSQGQGMSPSFGRGSMDLGRSSQMSSLSYDRDASAMGAQGRSMFAGRGPKGYRRSDERIMEEVCETLTHHPQIDASEIEVKVEDGHVNLMGSVDSRLAKRMAEDIVENVSGVRDVKNELRVTMMSQGQMGMQNQQNLQSQFGSLGQSGSSGASLNSGSALGGSDYNLSQTQSPTSSNASTSPSGTTSGSSASTSRTDSTSKAGDPQRIL